MTCPLHTTNEHRHTGPPDIFQFTAQPSHIRDDHVARVQESTPAGVCIFRQSKNQSVKFKIEPKQETEPESVLHSVQESRNIWDFRLCLKKCCLLHTNRKIWWNQNQQQYFQA